MTAHEIVSQLLIDKLSRGESDDVAELIVDALAKADLLHEDGCPDDVDLVGAR